MSLALRRSETVSPARPQIAKAVGARVVAVARGAAKLEALRAQGADVCVDSAALGKGGLKAALEEKGVKGGVDVVYDPIGGKLFMDSLRVVKWGGQVAVRAISGIHPSARSCTWFVCASLTLCRDRCPIQVIGFASGDIPNIPASLLLVKNVTVHGIYWGARKREKQRRPRLYPLEPSS